MDTTRALGGGPVGPAADISAVGEASSVVIVLGEGATRLAIIIAHIGKFFSSVFGK